jgi:hypothetical protein
MSGDTPVLPGAVEWTGDNPFIYLSADGTTTSWATLALFFRVAMSPHGGGCMALVLEAPYRADAPDACRLCLTDNDALAGYLLDGFVTRFPLSRPVPYLGALKHVRAVSHASERDGGDWRESIVSADGEITAELQWMGLSTPFAVAVPPEHSATGEHDMLSVFSIAASASVIVNGRRLPGHTVEREFFNRPATSAALALSETWIRAQPVATADPAPEIGASR